MRRRFFTATAIAAALLLGTVGCDDPAILFGYLDRMDEQFSLLEPIEGVELHDTVTLPTWPHVVAFDGALWAFGGYVGASGRVWEMLPNPENPTTTYYEMTESTTIFSSSDGVSWEDSGSELPFEPNARYLKGVFVHEGAIWYVGHDSVWRTSNGTDWVEVPNAYIPGDFEAPDVPLVSYHGQFVFLDVQNKVVSRTTDFDYQSYVGDGYAFVDIVYVGFAVVFQDRIWLYAYADGESSVSAFSTNDVIDSDTLEYWTEHGEVIMDDGYPLDLEDASWWTDREMPLRVETDADSIRILTDSGYLESTDGITWREVVLPEYLGSRGGTTRFIHDGKLVEIGGLIERSMWVYEMRHGNSPWASENANPDAPWEYRDEVGDPLDPGYVMSNIVWRWNSLDPEDYE